MGGLTTKFQVGDKVRIAREDNSGMRNGNCSGEGIGYEFTVADILRSTNTWYRSSVGYTNGVREDLLELAEKKDFFKAGIMVRINRASTSHYGEPGCADLVGKICEIEDEEDDEGDVCVWNPTKTRYYLFQKGDLSIPITFRVGDVVKARYGNKQRKENYGITTDGWMGTVIRLLKDDIMEVKPLPGHRGSREFQVKNSDEYFELMPTTTVNKPTVVDGYVWAGHVTPGMTIVDEASTVSKPWYIMADPTKDYPVIHKYGCDWGIMSRPHGIDTWSNTSPDSPKLSYSSMMEAWKAFKPKPSQLIFMDIKNKIKVALMSADQKTLYTAGILDENKDMTMHGRPAFIDFLYTKFGTEFEAYMAPLVDTNKE